MSREAVVRAGQRLEQFLKDEVVQTAFSVLRNKYTEDFKNAKSSEDRVRAWAQFVVADDFESLLRATVSAGEHAALEMVQLANKEVARKQGRPLPRE